VVRVRHRSMRWLGKSQFSVKWNYPAAISIAGNARGMQGIEFLIADELGNIPARAWIRKDCSELPITAVRGMEVFKERTMAN
jgi:hypothetical protein